MTVKKTPLANYPHRVVYYDKQTTRTHEAIFECNDFDFHGEGPNRVFCAIDAHGKTVFAVPAKQLVIFHRIEGVKIEQCSETTPKKGSKSSGLKLAGSGTTPS